MNIHELHIKLKEKNPEWTPQNEIYRYTVQRYANRDATVLDIGCGRTNYMAEVYSRVQKVIGLDPDIEALSENTAVQIKLSGGFEQLSKLSDQSIDIAVSSWVMEHIDNPDLMFTELKRIMKSGSRFISLTPNKHSLITKLSRITPNFLHKAIVKKIWGREEKDTYPTKYLLNDEKTIRNYAEKYGFIVEELQYLPDPTYYVFDTRLFDIIVNLHTKYIRKSQYEGLIFVLRKI